MASSISCSPKSQRTMTANVYSLVLQSIFSRVVLASFVFSYLCVDPVASSSSGCTFLLTKASGQISSPGYPGRYPRSAYCSWTIIMPENERVLLTFTTFDVESGTTNAVCDKDYVEVFDGTKEFNSLGKFCNSVGHYPKGTIRSTYSSMRVKFKSDAFNRPGFTGLFQANYQKQPCGDYLTGLKGEISSPNYPNPYPASKECIWKIAVPSNKVIRLYFLDFSIEPTSECNLDFIKIRDGFNVTSRLMGHFCAKRKPMYEIRSTGNQMWLEFKSFKPTFSIGFKAYYDSEPHCGGLLVGPLGSFTSPELPQDANQNAECTWKIQAGAGEIVSVVFSRFDVNSEGNTNCRNDYVEFYDGADDTSKVIGRYCNLVKIPADIRSTGKHMFVKLHRSVHSRGTGFFTTYTSVDPKNHFDKCSESANELLYRCDNGNYIQCQWKCDGTDDCGDKSDEKNCQEHVSTPQPSKLRNYVIILVSITGSAVAIVLIAFVVDRLRKKRRARARVRRRRRRHRLGAIDGPRLGDTGSEPSSPPPPYEFTATVSNCLDTGPLHPPPYSTHNTLSETANQDTSTSDAGLTLQELAAGSNSEDAQQLGGEQEHVPDTTTPSDTTELSIPEADVISLGGSPPTSDTSPLIT